MKKLIITLAICLIAVAGLVANHWNPNPSNNYQPMNIFVYGAEINGVPLVAGDEIGVFDGNTLVGAVLLTESIVSPASADIIVYMKELAGDTGCAIPGNFIKFKIWNSTTNAEYSYPEMSVHFGIDPYYGTISTTFQNLESSHIAMLSYNAPTGAVSQIVDAGENPGWVNNIAFAGTGVTINALYLNIGLDTGDANVYAFDTPSTDVSFSGTPPMNSSPYGWVIDLSDVSDRYISTSIPLSISFDIAGLPGVLNPDTVTLYYRAIHGTGPYSQVTANWNGTSLVTNITSLGSIGLGDFLLGGDSDNPLPVVLSSFNAIMTSVNDAVVLTWVTQSESNLTGYYIYKSNSNILAYAERVNALIPATNTSQTHEYSFSDSEILANNTYWYWLQVKEMNGFEDFHGPVNLTVPANGAVLPPVIPTITDISRIYPNPFAHNIKIVYALSKAGHVQLCVTNSKGQVVRTLVSDNKAAGTYPIIWDGKDDFGKNCTTGMYFLKMTTANKAYTKKVVLVK